MGMKTQLVKELKKFGNKKQAKNCLRFFKTGKGEYGEGDIFIGVKSPVQRKLAKQFQSLSLFDTVILLKSPIHEYRQTTLFILRYHYESADSATQKKIAKLYMVHIADSINNWDLVDCSAPYILGPYFLNKPKRQLYAFAKSKNLWERRVAILTTFAFIKNNDYSDALKIAKVLLHDEHDLMHKAVGWMLREVGNRDKKTEVVFLKKHAKRMPRTMLRYAIEKFPERERKMWLQQKPLT